MRKIYSLLILLLLSSTIQSQTDYYIGANSGTNTGSIYPAPLQDYWEGSRAQYLYTAAELQTAGMAVGNIYGIKISVTDLNGAGVIENYTISIGTTTTTSLTSTTWETLNGSAGPVFGPLNYTPVLGVNDFVFSSPFFWNGSDNIIVEICNGDANTTSGTFWSDNALSPWTTGLSFNGSHTYAVDNLDNLCGSATTTNRGDQTTRPDITFSWNSANACTAPPTAGIANASVTTACSGVPFTLSLSGSSIGTGLSYQWDSSANGTTWFPMPGDTTSTVSQTQISSSYYRCKVTCSGITGTSSPTLLIQTPPLVKGTFTINAGQPTGSGNFQTFAEAISSISCGIDSTVVFNVLPGSGPYMERVIIPAINGASSTNRVIINGNGETLLHNTSVSAERAALVLDGADFITIDSLNIDVSSGTYGWGIALTNQADSNVIRRCTITTSTSSTSSSFAGIVINGSVSGTSSQGNNGNGNLIEKNKIVGGYYGVYMYGSSSIGNESNRIIQNNIQEVYYYSIYMLYQSGAIVSKNDISRPTRTTLTTHYSIYSGTNCTNMLIEKNRIHNMFDGNTSSTSSFYGIYSSGDATLGNENRIENNLVYNISHNGTIYGIYNSGSDFCNIYHNTISLDEVNATSGSTYGFYQSGTATDIIFKNNIVTITRGGSGVKYCFYKSTSGNIITSDNNVFYINSSGSGTQAVGYQSGAQTTLSDWRTATGGDISSQEVDPFYIDPFTANFKPTTPSINNIGASVGVTTDILDVVRGSSPDPGAYEFVLGGCTNPPNAGIATASSSTVCPNVSFTLDLSGNSYGSGQTYQWQSSPNGNAPWTNIGSPETSPIFTHSQDTSTFYRCAVKCNAGSIVYSSIVEVASPLLVHGSFTINAGQPTGGGNFQTFAEAISSISCGIDSTVVFNVLPGSGPYMERVIIPAIGGASSTNKVIINGNGETLLHNTSVSAERAALVLDGADFITIDSLNIDVSSGTYGWGIALTNQADSNVIRRCTITTSTSSTSSSFAGIVINGSVSGTSSQGNNGNGNLIEKNKIVGGYYGVYMYGSSSIGNESNRIIQNNIQEVYYYSIYMLYQSGAIVSKNDISRPTRTTLTTHYSIYSGTNCTNMLIEKNRIHNMFDGNTSSTSSFYGIYSSGDATLGNENRIENNLIYNISHNGTIYGIYNSGSDFCNIYHNTISLDEVNATSGTTYGFYQSGTATDITFKNNIVTITRGGSGTKYCIYKSTAANDLDTDYNLYYMNSAGSGAQNIGYSGGAQATLADWQTATGDGTYSLTLDPMFVNASVGNFEPTASLLDNKGVFVGVTTDLRDSVRNNTTPDIGAIEFSTLTSGLNMGAVTVVTPTERDFGCYTTSEPVTIKIRNASTSTHDFSTNPVTVTTNITGATTQTLTATINTGTLASDSTLDVVMSANLDMSIAGNYTFDAYTTVAGDVNPANDAILPVGRTKVALTAGSPTSTPESFCITSGTPTLTATNANGYSSLQWQESSSSGGVFTNISGATTSPFTLSSNISQTMYYKLVAGCDATTLTSSELTVTLNNPSVLTKTDSSRCGPGSVTLKATGNIGSQLSWYNTSSGGTALATGTTFATPSISNTTTYYVGANNGGSSANLGATDPSSVGTISSATLTNHFMIFDVIGGPVTINSVDLYPTASIGSNYEIIIQDASLSQIFTSGSFTNSVTGGSLETKTLGATIPAGTGYRMGLISNAGLSRNTSGAVYPYTLPGVISITGNTFSTSYYYYFYNWQISTGCESPRTAVIATVNPNPPSVIVTPDHTNQCTNSPAQVLKASGGVGAGTYIWTPTTGLFTDAAATIAYTGTAEDSVYARPSVSTVYTSTSTNTNSCSSSDTVSVIVSCTLPVSYLSFAGVKEAGNNVLRWTTSTEQNNKGFDVERSLDGRVFSSIGFVASKGDHGNSNHELSYNFVDDKLSSSVYYYRLRQIDLNGKTSYSYTIVIKGDRVNTIKLSGLYPNPATEEVTVTIDAPSAEKVVLIITDIYGKQIMQQNMTVEVGSNNTKLNVGRLSSGIYLIQLHSTKTNTNSVLKFVKH